MNPCGTCYPCPGGEDHLKRRSSSPPVPPLLGCRHCSRESLSVGFTSNLRLPRRRDGCMAGSISAVNGLTPGCRGRSPRRNKLKISPFPAGEGGDQGYFSKGLRPRHPCTEPLAALTEPSSAVPGGGRARLVACLTLPPLYPAGGLPSLSPPYPALSLLSCPLSPRPPSPAGKGVTKVISCKGLRPLHPWG